MSETGKPEEAKPMANAAQERMETDFQRRAGIGLAGLLLLVATLQIGAGAEGAAAAGEDQGMGAALRHRGHGGQELGAHGGIDAVQPLGPIQRQHGDGAVDLAPDAGVSRSRVSRSCVSHGRHHRARGHPGWWRDDGR